MKCFTMKLRWFLFIITIFASTINAEAMDANFIDEIKDVIALKLSDDMKYDYVVVNITESNFIENEIQKVIVHHHKYGNKFAFNAIIPFRKGIAEIGGCFEEGIPVYSLKKSVNRNQVIEESDIKPLLVAKSKVNEKTILDKNDIIGSAVKRNLPTNYVIKNTDVTYPRIAFKGETLAAQYDKS